MNELLAKLSSYNLFNYLVPGVVFCALAERFTAFDLLGGNLAVDAFIAYFAGLVVSRVGSLVVEPALKKLKFVKFASYADFVAASKVDPMIETLSEANNTYRAFSALFVVLGGLIAYDRLLVDAGAIFSSPFVAIAALLALFLASYRKQTQYVASRVKSAAS